MRFSIALHNAYFICPLHLGSRIRALRIWKMVWRRRGAGDQHSVSIHTTTTITKHRPNRSTYPQITAAATKHIKQSNIRLPSHSEPNSCIRQTDFKTSWTIAKLVQIPRSRTTTTGSSPCSSAVHLPSPHYLPLPLYLHRHRNYCG